MAKGKVEKKPKTVAIIEDIDLTKYISPTLIEDLRTEYDAVCITPTSMFICVCKGKGKYRKSFNVGYPNPEDYKDKKLHLVSSGKPISKADIKRLKKALSMPQELEE